MVRTDSVSSDPAPVYAPTSTYTRGRYGRRPVLRGRCVSCASVLLPPGGRSDLTSDLTSVLRCPRVRGDALSNLTPPAVLGRSGAARFRGALLPSVVMASTTRTTSTEGTAGTAGMSRTWRCVGLRWVVQGPGLCWQPVPGPGPGRGPDAERGPRAGGPARERISVLAYGSELGFRAVGERRCTRGPGGRAAQSGRWCRRGPRGRGARSARGWTGRTRWPPTRSPTTRGTYRVYLAWFGPGMVKVGITARGAGLGAAAGAGRRGLQLAGPRAADGRPAYRGAAARRARGAGPDSVRAEAGGAGRAAGAAGAGRRDRGAARAGASALRRVAGVAGAAPAAQVVDHAGVFGLPGLGRAAGVVARAGGGGAVAGRLVAAAGPDLHLATRARRSCWCWTPG